VHLRSLATSTICEMPILVEGLSWLCDRVLQEGPHLTIRRRIWVTGPENVGDCAASEWALTTSDLSRYAY
jgi:hypothetical protein